MGRSSKNQATENRARVVEVASVLFRERGIEAVSIADVMKSAGMTQGGFYKQFDNKDALVAEACEFAFSRAEFNWRNVAYEALQKKENIAEAIRMYYLSPKPLGMCCPILAFAEDIVRRKKDDPLHKIYVQGVEVLFKTFTELLGKNGSKFSEDKIRSIFVSMIGANMLARSSDNSIWVK